MDQGASGELRFNPAGWQSCLRSGRIRGRRSAFARGYGVTGGASENGSAFAGLRSDRGQNGYCSGGETKFRGHGALIRALPIAHPSGFGPSCAASRGLDSPNGVWERGVKNASTELATASSSGGERGGCSREESSRRSLLLLVVDGGVGEFFALRVGPGDGDGAALAIG